MYKCSFPLLILPTSFLQVPLLLFSGSNSTQTFDEWSSPLFVSVFVFGMISATLLVPSLIFNFLLRRKLMQLNPKYQSTKPAVGKRQEKIAWK